MRKALFSVIMLLMISLRSFGGAIIYGPTVVCAGGTANVVDSALPGSGTWTSSNTAVATVTATSSLGATITGVSAGTTVITYTSGSSFISETFTVNPLPAAITGASTFCAGTSSPLFESVPGGTWHTYSWTASVALTTGVVTGVSGGTATITYMMPGGCSVTAVDTILATPIDSISRGLLANVCPGGTLALSDPVSGGTWSSSNTSVATVSSTGLVTAIATGVCTISYFTTGICGTVSVGKRVTVLPATASTPAISGPSSIDDGAVVTFSGSPRSGTWSSSNPSAGSVDASTGMVTGVAPGTTIISYSVTGCSGPVAGTQTVSVLPFNGISGRVFFPGKGGYYYGNVKVYLITYNPTAYTLQAVDSVSVPMAWRDSIAYYSFPGVSTDSFRIKAVGYDTSAAYTGYIPTYHTSSYYWYSADVLYHTSGAADIFQDINMMYGTVTPGSGFIGGSISAGANKGSGSSDGVSGMRLFLINSSTGEMIQQTKTNSSGIYKFENIPYGTYFIHPEEGGYLTTPYTGVTVSSSAKTISGANFIKHTISHTITPVINSVKNTGNETSFFVYPNPTEGILNLNWNMSLAEAATVTISNVAGQNVQISPLLLTKGAGIYKMNLSHLPGGVYIVNVRSASVNFNDKVTIRK